MIPATLFSPRPGRRLILCAGLVALASLWMRAGFPVQAIGNAGYDDALFLRTARFIGNGEWLGPYGPVTLVKGVFYPLFILAAFIAHVPLLVAEQAAYLAASAMAAMLVARHARPWIGLALFGLLAGNPVLWDGELQRVIREGLYVSLTLGCVCLMAACVFAHSVRGGLAAGAGLGLTLGAFWLTREEGPWLLPALASIPAVALVPTVAGRRRRARATRMAGPLLLAGALAVAMVAGVAALNWRVYGVFLTTEFQWGTFPKAYGALARITTDRPAPFLVLAADAEARAVSVSPAMAALAPALDGPIGRKFAATGCAQMQVEPCPGILAGWFMWTVRDAAGEAGLAGTLPEAQAFDGRLADEVNGACDAGRIPCGPPLRGFLPPFRLANVAAAARNALSLAWIVAQVGTEGVGSPPSRGWPYGIEVFEDMVGRVSPATGARRVAGGQVSGPVAALTVGGVAAPAYSNVATTPVDATNGAPSGAGASLFELQADCPDECWLVAVAADGQSVRVPLPQQGKAAPVSAAGMAVAIDGAQPRDPRAGSRALSAVHYKLARAISRLYREAMPVLEGAAGLGLAAALLRARRRPVSVPLMALALAAGIAIVTRILLLAYLDATSFPAVNVLYASPLSPLVLVFAVSGLWLGWCALSPRRVRWAP